MYYKLSNNKSNFLIQNKVFVPTGTSELLIEATEKVIKKKKKNRLLLRYLKKILWKRRMLMSRYKKKPM